MTDLSPAKTIIAARRSDQKARLDRARRFVETLPDNIGLRFAVVFGSVARGDFNVWSDIDLLVVAEHLPSRPQDRLALVDARAPSGVAPVVWTTAEFQRELERGNPIATEAARNGIVLRGHASFSSQAT